MESSIPLLSPEGFRILKRRRNSESSLVRPEQSKVLSEKLIFYCSDFDLNANEWYCEFENIYIFKKRVQKHLGKQFQQHFLTFV